MKKLLLHGPSLVLAVAAVLVSLFGRTDTLVVVILAALAVATAIQAVTLIRLYRRHHGDL